MEKIQQLYGARYFTKGELVNIGQRLSKGKLEEMELLQTVQEAELELIWRLKASIELLTPMTHIFPEKLLVELNRAEQQLANPIRGQAKEIGGTPKPEGRTLPKVGTILVRLHDYQWYNIKKLTNPDGTETFKYKDSFRFLVVEQPCKLLRLDEPEGPIYRSPSDAASRATGSRVNG